MKIKPSRQPGHVVFDVGASDVSLLENITGGPDVVSTVVGYENTFQAQLNERANKRTRLMEEILSRSGAGVPRIRASETRTR